MKRFYFTNNKSPNMVVLLAAFFISGCTLGPDYHKPQLDIPADWATWRSGDASLHTLPRTAGMADAQWWKHYNDPILNGLIDRALAASPDIKSATLRFFSARARYRMATSTQMPEINAFGKINREKLSENSPFTRVVKGALPEPEQLINLMAEPYNWYQAGLDFSWEIDLWGHVRRAIEAADADVASQQALLEFARLSIVGDVVNNYYNLRAIQQQVALATEDMQAIDERLALIKARTEGGTLDHIGLERQRGELATARSSVVELQVQEGIIINQLLLLLGEHPGALQQELQFRPTTLNLNTLPPLQLGIPSEVALSRPDIRAAEARLHAATARIGVAEAELYPSITLGAQIGLDAYLENHFAEWASRTWSVGPSLNLPLFDRGRRKAVVVLHKVEQQQAAVDFHQTVLRAWQEIDNALSGYTAAQQKLKEQMQHNKSAQQALWLVQARYNGGLTNFINVLDSQRSYIQSCQALAMSQRDMQVAWAAVNRSVGNFPRT